MADWGRGGTWGFPWWGNGFIYPVIVILIILIAAATYG
jgi:hypothetical protein